MVIPRNYPSPINVTASSPATHTRYRMEHVFYKLDVQGIVYLIDPATSKAYTYDLEHPTEIGKIVWADPKDTPTIELLVDWKSILEAKKSEASPLN
jgi:hypothetical protein